jgi:site-specific recombinase
VKQPPRAADWDLSALLTAADPRASRPERHLWLVRLVEWLRHGSAAPTSGDTPRPVLRLKLLLNALERNTEPRERVLALLTRFWRETDMAALFADFGFTARRDLLGEMGERLALRLLPGTPDTDDLGALFQLLFTEDADAAWMAAIDEATLARLSALLTVARAGTGSVSVSVSRSGSGNAALGSVDDWRAPLLQAMTWLVSAIRAAAFAPLLRRRMSAELLADRPFEQLVRALEATASALLTGPPESVAQHAVYLRALLQRCREAANSVHTHLEEHGVSVNIVFEVDQLCQRTLRLEALLDLVLSDTPQRELQDLLVDLITLARQRRRLGGLLARQYSLLARKVAERHAETGEHYITRSWPEYRAMLGKAAGGGAVLAGTTFAKFGILALGLAPFWAGFGAGLNYAISFLIVHLLHWTVATKQPAMTAPAMAEKLGELRRESASEARAEHPPEAALAGAAIGVETDVASPAAGHATGHAATRAATRAATPAPGAAGAAADGKPRADHDSAAVEGFVDEVTHLVRSQMAGIVGNLAMVIPVVLAVQGVAWWALGRPLVGVADAKHVLDNLTLLGPTAFFAAFTGVLLFASSVVAGWAENWFVYHRLDSALAHNPRIVARLGAPRAQRWSVWWRANVSGLAANVSLGLMLGLVPVLLAFLGLHIEVRHVTLSTGQLAAAVSTLGWQLLAQREFWWCVAGLAVTGFLNLGVSFALALRVAMRSRGITLIEQRRLNGALWRRLRQAPLSFLLPV